MCSLFSYYLKKPDAGINLTFKDLNKHKVVESLFRVLDI